MIGNEMDSAAENKPFVCEDEERKPGDKPKEREKAHMKEEVKPFGRLLLCMLCPRTSANDG